MRSPADRETQGIAVLAIKESHCLEALFEAWVNDDLRAEIPVVVGNHDDRGPLAEQYGVPFHDIGNENGSANEGRLLGLLARYEVDLIVLAHYMRISRSCNAAAASPSNPRRCWRPFACASIGRRHRGVRFRRGDGTHQPGMDRAIDEVNPDRSIDGIGRALTD